MDDRSLVAAVQPRLQEVADPAKAGSMAAYMKTEMPFYGVQKAGRTAILRQIRSDFAPDDLQEYEAAVLALWDLPHREEKYLAIGYARSFETFISSDSLELYEQLIIEGAWWDFVDEIASHLVGRALFKDRGPTEVEVRSWITSDKMWLRRTSIISQLRHKADTDTGLLDDACTANLADPEFFIRKAIGWALREYAKTNPDWVRSYVAAHRDGLSPLSHR
ncbi:MAG: DNA alkylation repair protein, partial [Actinomycetota bacterium]